MEITSVNSYSKLYHRKQQFKQHPQSFIKDFTQRDTQVSQPRKKVSFKAL